MTGLFAKARKTKAYQMTPDDWATLNDIDETNLRPMDITFGNRMKNQLTDFVPVYVACGERKKEQSTTSSLTKSLENWMRNMMPMLPIV